MNSSGFIMHGDGMSSVSKNIKKMRLKRGLTQEEIADKLFVTRQTVSNWENGKSQPDIDSLIRIAETLDTDTTTLIYGPPSSENQKRDKKHFLIACGILLVLCIIIYLLSQTAADMKKYYIVQPFLFLKLLFLPAFWLILGWAAMQGAGIFHIVKPCGSKYSNPIHIAVLTIVLLYAAVMLPFFVEMAINFIPILQYVRNPSPDLGEYHYISFIPVFLSIIEMSIMNFIYSWHVIFVVPGIVFWFSKPVKQEAGENKS